MEHKSPQTETEKGGTISDRVIRSLSESKPNFKNAFEAVSAVLHIIMKELGFRCIGVREKHDPQANEKVLPDGWNEVGDLFSFTYKHPRSSMTFVLKCLVIGDKLLVNGVGIEDKKIHTIELDAQSLLQGNVSTEDFKSLFKDLNKLIELFQKEVITKLLPLTSSEASTQQESRTQERDVDPLRIPDSRTRQPYSPLMERPPEPLTPFSPFSTGGNDVFPLPGPFEGQQGGPGRGGGNLIGPQHPGFGPYVTDPYGGSPFGRGRGRGRGGHPPGARFDPFGPPTTDFGNPDPDEFQPPRGGGYDDYIG